MRSTGVALLLTLAACGKVVGDLPDDGDGDGGGGIADGGIRDARGADGPANAVDTVRELRLSPPRPGDTVTLRGVVVTGRTAGRSGGTVFVQDPGGGSQSGLRLTCALDQTCPTTRAQIEGLQLGQVLDVAGVFDVTAVPLEPQLVRFSFTPRGGTTAPVATTVEATLVAHDQAGNTMVQPWLGAYVRVNGPLTVSNVMPAALRESCAAIDAGPGDAYRGVFMRPGTGPELAVQTIELSTCVSQCGTSCANEIQPGWTFASVTGVLIVERGTASPELLIRPSRNADLPQ